MTISRSKIIRFTTPATSQRDSAQGLAIDANGNIYVSGYAGGSINSLSYAGGPNDAFLIKYSNDGTAQFTRLWGGSSEDAATDIAISSDGLSIIASGYSYSAIDGQSFNGGVADAMVVKFDSSGNKQWTRLIGSTLWDAGYGIVQNKDGLIYVTGGTNGVIDQKANGGLTDYFINKLDSSGTKIWTAVSGNIAADSGRAIAMAADGSILVASLYGPGYTQDQWSVVDARVTKYAATGEVIWTTTFGQAGSNDEPWGLVSSSDGSTYVCGRSDANLGPQGTYEPGDAYLVKIDATGAVLWTRLIASPGVDIAWNVTTGPTGAVIVVGNTTGTLSGTREGGADVFVAGFSPNGDQLWIETFGDSANEKPIDVVMDPFGSVYIAGETDGNLYGIANQGKLDPFLVKIDASVFPKFFDNYLTLAEGQYLTGADANLPFNNSPRTLEAWIRTTASGSMSVVAGYGDFSAPGKWFGLQVSADGKAYFCGYAADLIGSKTVNDGNWHKVDVTYDGSRVSIYIDNVLDVSSLATTAGFESNIFTNLATAQGDLRVGRAFGNFQFVGDIKGLAIYDKALTESEIKS